MARIAGIDLPANKRVEIGLTYIFGIGRSSSVDILTGAQVDKNTRVKDLSDEELAKIRKIVQGMTVEGDLRRSVSMDIKRLVDLGCYRGLRHRRGLPCHGQRTKTNARTRKGPKRLAAPKKK
ncbi:MAG: 30S ribosomal protein S13 [SAR324 cluster bacterium]|uniref:Small ribosomal subunit protein uS13 n=1 Tax=SAR324 cluster bacterium TaxID=2024889 RepID=A0A2A4T478_9DELT|nr:MAG: 30S ribosomal protein S13 [SAR324 cluster bacterium]